MPHTTIKNSILDTHDKPSQTLLDLLDLLKTPHDGSLQSIVTATQKAWLRQSGKERWQVDELYPEMRETLTPYFKELGLFDEIKPSKKHYDYIVLLGSTVSSFRDKMAHMITLWQRGIRFNQVIMLGSERKLDPIIESKEILLDAQNPYLPVRADWHYDSKPITTEYEMLKMVYDQADLPAELRAIPVTTINAPNTINPDGAVKRATTDDTIFAWLKENPTPGSSLFISHQPFIWYQDSAVRTFMPETFEIETVCPKIERESGSPLCENGVKANLEILDALARFLYQENLRVQKR